ncbi:hypothetical protein ACHAQA_006554 [Verticillium albo-atrum]
MPTPTNQAAWIDSKGAPLRVGEAPMPTPGEGDIVIRSRAVAINPLDWHMQDWGVFIKEWPSIFGCDVAGEVHQVGPDVSRFKPGDRVIAHTINLVTGKPRDAAFAHYCVAPATKVALLPASISFESGAVLPLALEAAVCGLTLQTPGVAMPGVSTPALGLPVPKLEPAPIGKSILVYGGSSSVGLLTIQIAVAIGLEVITTASPHNFDLCKSVGAAEVFNYKDPQFVEKVVAAFTGRGDFVGILDAVSIDETYAHNKEILAKLGGGHLACTHPPPTEVADNVKAGMLFAVNDIAQPVWEGFVTPALEAGMLKCLPEPLVVGHGLEFIQEALDKSKAGVSARKLVVTM